MLRWNLLRKPLLSACAEHYFIRSRKIQAASMACSRFEYVKDYEQPDRLQPNCWIVIRIDGKGFTKFCAKHEFAKPNDDRGLNLMSLAALKVMQEFNEIMLAYGQSDEYSFVFRRDTSAFKRRREKLTSYVVSLFTSAYVFNWDRFFGATAVSLKYPPVFDSRAVLYPTDQNLRDYVSWRQADVHVNNLYNTAFWNLVQRGGQTNQKAEERLRGTLSGEKNEILFKEFGINYNNEPIMYRKGTTLLRKKVEVGGPKALALIVPVFEDMINDEFWIRHPELLDGKLAPTEKYDLGDRHDHALVQYQLEQHYKKTAKLKDKSVSSQ